MISALRDPSHLLRRHDGRATLTRFSCNRCCQAPGIHDRARRRIQSLQPFHIRLQLLDRLDRQHLQAEDAILLAPRLELMQDRDLLRFGGHDPGADLLAGDLALGTVPANFSTTFHTEFRLERARMGIKPRMNDAAVSATGVLRH